MVPAPIHENLLRLLKDEDPAVRHFLMRTIKLSQASRLSAESLVPQLQRELDKTIKEDFDADSED